MVLTFSENCQLVTKQNISQQAVTSSDLDGFPFGHFTLKNSHIHNFRRKEKN